MHKLIIEDDEGRTTVVPLVRDELTIGRKEGNTIRLTERNVSRRHARLTKQNGAVYIEDLGSHTGVRINGTKITAITPVHDGDQVEIGDYKLSVRSDAGDELPQTARNLPAPQPPISTLSLPVGAAPVVGAPVAAAAASGQVSAAAPAPAATASPAGVPSARVEAAPTIPLKTLAEQGRLPNMAPGRLVVVSTGLAGLELRLDRPSLVIGRTEENDLIINHPSISRHHAKITHEGDKYTVVDLQSANGVRVSGESYERVDLQAGDVIELGHVKLRFVGPWENWTFDPQEFAQKSRRSLKIGAAVGGVVIAGVLIIALQGRKPAAPPEAAPVAVAAAPAPPTGPSPEELLAQATTAAKAEDWEKSVTALDLLMSRPASEPGIASVQARAAELKKKVDFERRSAELFASFRAAVTSKEPDVALSRFEDIPAESGYKEKAADDLPAMKDLFLAAHIDLADSARQQGRCDEARGEVEKIQQVDPENRKAREIAKSCRQHLAATAPALGPKAGPRAGARVPTAARTAPARSAVATDDGPTAAADQPDAADLIKEAREAWLHQQCGTAIELSRRALKQKPGATDAHQIIAVCSCSTKDRDGAARSYAKLDERSRAMVRSICARNGIELGE